MADEMAKVIEELARVKNVGPARAEQIYRELQISTLDELIKAAAAHRLQTLSGIGEKTEASILQSAQRQVSVARVEPQIESEVLTEQDFMTAAPDEDPEVEILSEDEFFQDDPEELTAASAEILAIREELANVEVPAAQLPSGALRDLSLVEDALDRLGQAAPDRQPEPEPEPEPEPAPLAQPKAVLKKALARKLRAAKRADAEPESVESSEAPSSTSAAAADQVDTAQDVEVAQPTMSSAPPSEPEPTLTVPVAAPVAEPEPIIEPEPEPTPALESPLKTSEEAPKVEPVAEPEPVSAASKLKAARLLAKLKPALEPESVAAQSVTPSVEAAPLSASAPSDADELYDPLVEAAEHLVTRSTEPSLAQESEPAEPHAAAQAVDALDAAPSEPEPTPAPAPNSPHFGWEWESEAKQEPDVEPVAAQEPVAEPEQPEVEATPTSTPAPEQAAESEPIVEPEPEPAATQALEPSSLKTSEEAEPEPELATAPEPEPAPAPEASLAAGWELESEAKQEPDVEPTPIAEPPAAVIEQELESAVVPEPVAESEPADEPVQPDVEAAPALIQAEDALAQPQDEPALEAQPQPSTPIEDEEQEEVAAQAPAEESQEVASRDDEVSDESPQAESLTEHEEPVEAPLDEAVEVTAPSAVSAEALFLGSLICPNCGHDELRVKGRVLVCQACRREYDRVAGVTQLAPPTRTYDVGLAQRVMETQLYASLYEQVMRPKLTSLVTERTLTQEYILATEYLELSPGVRLLDVACGTGNFTRHFADALRDLGPGAAAPSLLVGLDMSEPMLTKASEYLKAAEMVDEIFLVRGDATRLPFGRGAFDRVHCAGALHMMEEPDEALRHFARVLRPDGLLVIGTFVEGSGLLRRALKRAAQLPTHFRWFNPQELRQRLERAGFEVQAQSQAQDALTLKARRV